MDAGEPFYVVRKGNVIGIYKTLSECQAQVSNSVCDPSVTVFKGYSLRKETEEYLAARGLRNAVYAIDAADARDDLFGNLVPCPFQVIFFLNLRRYIVLYGSNSASDLGTYAYGHMFSAFDLGKIAMALSFMSLPWLILHLPGTSDLFIV